MSEPLEGEIVNQSIGVKLTKHPEDTVRLLEAAFNHDFNITEACQYASISRETYYKWLEDDDIFSYRMSVAQSAPHRKAKQNIITAIEQGDPNISLRYLQLRDPDYKPKIGVDPNPDIISTREKIKGFLDDTSDINATSSQPTASDTAGVGSEVAQTPTDIS